MDKFKRGRPTENPKTYMLRVRMDSETLKKLNKYASVMGISKSQAVRLAITHLKQIIQKDD